MKKEKVSLFLTEDESTFLDLIKFFDSVENIEHIFDIEFACGIETVDDKQKAIFLSDHLFTETEDEILEKYDGNVISHLFRINSTKKIIDVTVTPCRFDILYDPDYVQNNSQEFSDPKIITKGIPKEIHPKFFFID